MTLPRPNVFASLLTLAFTLTLSACAALSRPLATATPRPPTATLIPTATVLWFPPSATPSPRPTFAPSPTKAMLVGLGPLLFRDTFTSPDSWTTAASDQGSAAISRRRLTLAVQPGIYLISLQQELTLSDFYAEITARPSLCRGADEYGMLFRASAVAYYRYALACDGTVRLERISVSERHVLIPTTPSGDAPRGAPGEVRLGVWAAGEEMRFFLNGHYQFSAWDPNLPSGTLGVFVRAAGETPVTVVFTDLVVYAVTYASPTPTLTPTATPRPTRTPSATP